MTGRYRKREVHEGRVPLSFVAFGRGKAPRISGGPCGGDYAVGDAGGAATEELAAYSHTGGSVFGTFYAAQTATRENRPPYYALCCIMKL